MKTEEKIQLESLTKFVLSKNEKERFYVKMALLRYFHDCVPDYDEQSLLIKLSKRFEKYNKEIIRLSELDPNNLILNDLRVFINSHHSNLKRSLEK